MNCHTLNPSPQAHKDREPRDKQKSICKCLSKKIHYKEASENGTSAMSHLR